MPPSLTLVPDSPNRETIERAIEVAKELKRRREANPLKYMRWLPGQHAFLSSTAKQKCMRSGNQMTGKTTAGVQETHGRCTGTHPYRPDLPKPPVEIMCVGGTHTQSLTIQQKFWNLIDRRELMDDCFFDDKKGAFTGKYPKARYKNGSVVHFESGRGDVLSKAGKTLDAVWIDEPPRSERLYSELRKRIARKNGDLYLTFTPVNAPVEWIKEECEAGRIEDLHFPITVPNLTFVGTNEVICLEDGTPCDQEWLDAYIANELPYEVPVVIGGEWEFRADGQLFRAYRDSGDQAHVSADVEDCEYDFCLGIDHGFDTFAACATLLGVKKRSLYGHHHEVVVLGEWYSDGETTTDQDAEAIVDLARSVAPHLSKRKAWAQLHRVFGDVPHGGKKMSVSRKSNAELMRAIARVLGTNDLKPIIRTVRKPQRSRAFNFKRLHQLMLWPGGFQVHPRCERLRKCLLNSDGRANDQWSHQIDSMRYGINHILLENRTWRLAPAPQVHQV